MGLQEDFEKAAEDAKQIRPEPDDDDKLVLYGLYKQATVGDINTKKPGMFDPKGRYKWNAWNDVKGKSKDDAMTEYIASVKKLQAGESISED